MGVAFSGLPAGTYYAMTGGDTNSSSSNVTANFGVASFAYPPAAGVEAGLYSGTPYNPQTGVTSATLKCWFDASDASTVTLGTAPAIASIKEKISNLVFAAGGTAPTQSATAFSTGKNAMSFGTGSASWLTNATGVSIAAPYTAFFAAFWGNRTGSYSALNFQKGVASNAMNANAGVPLLSIYTYAAISSHAALINMTPVNGSYAETSTGVVPTSSRVLARIASGTSPGTAALYRDGVAQTKASAGTATYGTHNFTTLGTTDSTYLSNGAFGEILIYEGSGLTAGDITAIEAYLKAKWGTP